LSTNRSKDSSSEKKRLENEMELWERFAEGDESAREELILAYRPMVYWLAKKMKVQYSVYPDLISEGTVALIKAVDAFDLSRNNRFSTYAYYKIKGSMINYLQRVEAKAPTPVEDFFFESPAVNSDIRGEAERADWTIDLQQAISVLSDREADILRALVVEGRVAKEVAGEKEIDVSHVYRIRRSALEKLRKWFKEATTSI
jgi:RNA polymerase sporulation-specific sigma factor